VRKLTLSLCLVLGVQVAAQAQPGNRPQDLTFFSTLDDTDQPYALYLPKNASGVVNLRHGVLE
jgi:hypothetical protein